MAGMQKLCRITVPGLSVKRDFTAARQRLLAEFPDIQEVIATTAPQTLLVLCTGRENIDGWLDTLRSLATHELPKTGRLRRWRGGGLTGDDSAA
jgi:hypothetical protein